MNQEFELHPTNLQHSEFPQSELQHDAALLRIFIGSRDKHHGRNVFEIIVEEARAAGIAGATVFEGFIGFGANSVVHHVNLLRLSQDLPMVIEIVDEEAKVRAFLPKLETLLAGGGLITMERITILLYRPQEKSREPAS